MKIRQIGKYDGDIIKTIIENRDIDDVELFLNPNDKDDLDAFSLNNMKLGAEILLAHVNVDSNISILVDPDADGFTSASIIYQYIKKINSEAKIEYFLHDSKAHGLTEKILSQVAKSETEILVIPDAASNDEEGINRLYAMGIEVLIIDHHEVDDIPELGIIINNQFESNEETNKNLVGAGMVYKFCQALDSILGENYADDFFDLVAIGQVGDSSDISENEVRNLVFKGLGNIQNEFVKVVLKDHFGSLDDIAPRNLSFSIIPLINSVVRVGTMEEKDYLFRALNNIDVDKTYRVTKRKKNKTTGKFDSFEIDQTLYEYTYDICKRVKNRQASLVKKTMAKLDKDIDNSGGIAIGLLESSEHGSITGLVANKIASKYQKPALLLHYIENDGRGKYVGSGRGNTKVLESLKDWCNETGLVEFAQGHANAHGISIFEENFEAFKEETRKIEKQEFVYEVDLHLHGRHDIDEVLKVEEYKHLFGGKVHDPLFAFTGISVKKEYVRQRGSMLTIFDRGLEFVMFGAPEGLYESLTNNFDEYLTLDLVGRPGVNTWGNRIKPQIVLADLERNEEPIEIQETEKVTAETLVF